MKLEHLYGLIFGIIIFANASSGVGLLGLIPLIIAVGSALLYLVNIDYLAPKAILTFSNMSILGMMGVGIYEWVGGNPDWTMAIVTYLIILSTLLMMNFSLYPKRSYTDLMVVSNELTLLNKIQPYLVSPIPETDELITRLTYVINDIKFKLDLDLTNNTKVIKGGVIYLGKLEYAFKDYDNEYLDFIKKLVDGDITVVINSTEFAEDDSLKPDGDLRWMIIDNGSINNPKGELHNLRMLTKLIITPSKVYGVIDTSLI